MNLLHLDSSALRETSVTRELSAAVVAQLTAPNTTVTYRAPPVALPDGRKLGRGPWPGRVGANGSSGAIHVSRTRFA